MTRRVKLPTFPRMRCDDHCGDCCGPVPVSQAEFDRIRAYAKAHGVEPARQGITCPMYQKGKCAVHPVRPILCRAFGHVPEMSCSRGYNVDIPKHLIDREIEHSKSQRMIHEMAGYTAEETKAMIDEVIASAKGGAPHAL